MATPAPPTAADDQNNDPFAPRPLPTRQKPAGPVPTLARPRAPVPTAIPRFPSEISGLDKNDKIEDPLADDDEDWSGFKSGKAVPTPAPPTNTDNKNERIDDPFGDDDDDWSGFKSAEKSPTPAATTTTDHRIEDPFAGDDDDWSGFKSAEISPTPAAPALPTPAAPATTTIRRHPSDDFLDLKSTASQFKGERGCLFHL